MGNQAKISQIQKRIAAEHNGKAQPVITNRLPPAAFQRLAALDQRVAAAKQAFQQFFDGVVIGLGIDIDNNIVTLGNDGTFTITPKGTQDAKGQEQSAGGIPDVEELSAEAESESES